MIKTVINIPSVVTKITTMADRSIRLLVDTQELTPEAKASVFELHEKYGYFSFVEQPLEELPEVPEYNPIEKNDKTPSERLRAVLYVLWEKQGSRGDSDAFYRQHMEKFINMVKERLP